MTGQEFKNLIEKNRSGIPTIVPFDNAFDKIGSLDLSPGNTTFTAEIYNDLNLFSNWIKLQQEMADARYLSGGYMENRAMYQRSNLFDTDEEPRSIHLGIDIWGDAGTPVFAPLSGTVHSYKFNDNFGDYGGTIILKHMLDGYVFHTLYGHLALKDMESLKVGDQIIQGMEFAHFGIPAENGHWPPHLHFQVIIDMGSLQGDYPGVCTKPESADYLLNCPDPASLLEF